MLNLFKSRGQMAIATSVGLFLLLSAFFGGIILQTYREYQNFKAQKLRLEEKLTQARKELEYKEMYISLLEDPDFVERVARERLGYARPDELLFRFSDEL